MKIGYFVSEFPEFDINTMEICNGRGGGVGYVAYHLAKCMSMRNHEVHVFTTGDSNDIIKLRDNFFLHTYKSSFTIGQAPISISLLLKPLADACDLDIIHCHIGNLPAPLTGYLLAKKKKIPLIVTHHGCWIDDYGSIPRRICVMFYKKILCPILFDSSNKIIALSNQHLQGNKELLKNESKVVIIPNGIDISNLSTHVDKKECKQLLGLPIEGKIMLFVGSFSPSKSLDVLIASMKNILVAEPDSHLVLAGDGCLKANLVELSNRLNLSSKIFFIGHVGGEKKRLLFKSADLFILPSKSEAFPIVLLEASSCNLPIVASDINCIKEIVSHKINGLTFKCGDSYDLAEKVISCLKNQELSAKLGKRANELVKKFHWNHIALLNEQLYLSLTIDKRN